MKTQSVAQHTPGPWKVKVPEAGFNLSYVLLGGPDGVYIGNIIDGKNADLIRRAVNSHEELLEFAKNMRLVCEAITSGNGEFEPLGVRVVVESIIAKAEK